MPRQQRADNEALGRANNEADYRPDRRTGGHHPPVGIRLAFLGMFLLLLAAVLSFAWFIVDKIYQYTTVPPQPLAFLTTVAAGLGLTVGICATAGWITRRTGNRRRAEHRQAPWNFGQNLLEALDRIAQGDFNVNIVANEHDPYWEVTESVNRMARELGTMEGQRQEFIASVSHEIQSPLTSISGFAALLRDPTLPEEKRQHYLGIIEAESRRLSKLSDNLLRLTALDSTEQALQNTRFSLDEQLRSVAVMFEPQWTAKQISLELNLSPIEFFGDADLLQQVWINLLHNALKFTPEAGLITVQLKYDNNMISCYIADNGCGMSAEELVHIFERFYRADKSRDRSLGGNGLGLPLAKRIVELHDGSISVSSSEGVGTTFTVALPR